MKQPIFLSIIFVLSACSLNNNLSKNTMVDAFPEAYIGQWKGDLVIRRDGDILEQLPMALHISAIGNGDYQWNIHYGNDDEADLRPYILRCTDPDKDLYEVDELNGIVLPANLHGNRLISLYSVEDNLIQATYSFSRKTIVFEILVSRPSPVAVTGDTTINGEYVPLVDLYPVVLSQKAVLKR